MSSGNSVLKTSGLIIPYFQWYVQMYAIPYLVPLTNIAMTGGIYQRLIKFSYLALKVLYILLLPSQLRGLPQLSRF